jgi:hypothetical protein
MIPMDGFDLEASKFHADGFVFSFPRFGLYIEYVTIAIPSTG